MIKIFKRKDKTPPELPKVSDGTLYPILQDLIKLEKQKVAKEMAKEYFVQQVEAIVKTREARIDSRGSSFCRNVYTDLNGVLHSLPFNGGEGMWHFDGQFFFKCKLKQREVWPPDPGLVTVEFHG